MELTKGDIITCVNRKEAVEVQLELAILGYDSSAYQTVSEEVIVEVGERSGNKSE